MYKLLLKGRAMTIGRILGRLGLGFGLSLGGAAALGAAAWGQGTAPVESVIAPAPPGRLSPAPTPAAEDAVAGRLSPAGLLSGPSLRETGRIGTVPQTAPTEIQPEEDLGTRHEKSIRPVAAGLDAPPPRQPAGVINQQILEQEIQARFAAVEGCRVDVARTKRIAPSEVVANTLALRWTIQENGGTVSTAVVATTPVDLEVMDCAKAAMSHWRFTAPKGGPVELERTFTFRPLRS